MSTITVTFGDCAENHVGMQKIGELAENGFSHAELIEFKKYFDNLDFETNLIDLVKLGEKDHDPAYVLVVRDGVLAFTDPDMFLQEQLALSWDKKAKMRGRVVNKRARHNLVYDEISQEPDYENGKGRIVAFKDVPNLAEVRDGLNTLTNSCLLAEGNHYYKDHCGIGYHGDSERRKVVGVRLGESTPLCYQWYHWSNPIGDNGKIILNHGDIYFMSEKATGFDWKKRSQITLRHAAGARKYINPRGIDQVIMDELF